MKSSLRLLCVSAIAFSAACQIADAELPEPRVPYSNEAGSDGHSEAGSSSLPVGGSASGAAGKSANPVGGSGGKVAVGGAGGAGGSAQGAAGMMASAGGSQGVAGKPAAGSGGSEQPAAGSGGGSTCPTSYVAAAHIVLNVSWADSLALPEGSGKVHIWTKSKFNENGSSITTESQPCGSTLPKITTKPIAGEDTILLEIDPLAWDEPTMPRFTGTATKEGNTTTVSSGAALVGLSMSDPTAAWPAATAITSVDHDGDGHPGITTKPRQTSGYDAPPVEIKLFGEPLRADELYLAIRNEMTLTSTTEGCPDSFSGTANVTKFDSHVIGCHVKGGSECTKDQKKFVDDNRTNYIVGSATFTSVRVSADATCEDVRAALPVQ